VKLLVQCSSIQDRKTVFYFNELCWGDGSSLRSQTFHHDYLHSCLPALFIAVPRLINLTFIGGKHMPISHYFLLLLCLFTMEIHKWDNLDLVCSCFNRVLVNFFFSLRRDIIFLKKIFYSLSCLIVFFFFFSFLLKI
jgi:hypothetical protein